MNTESTSFHEVDESPSPALLRPQLAARHLGISVDTLKLWEAKGHITSTRTVGGHRRYRLEDLDALRTKHGGSHD
ncbi:MAG: MerR family DNA-binding transcriptional regulator [Schaalia turicensis]|nr:MerR family DNA-binding transcriptional regulator [Schaalia turicensis]